MRIIADSSLKRFATIYPDAERALKAWQEDTDEASWKTPHDVRRYDPSASFLGNGRVCFNIRGNAYRLIVGINYDTEIVFIKWFGNHAEYDRVDANTVENF